MKQRVLTAILIIAIAIPLLIIGKVPFAVAIAVLSVGGFYELVKLREGENKLPTLMKVIASVLLILLTLVQGGTSYEFAVDYRITTAVIFFLTIPIIFYNKNKYNITDALFLIGSVFFLGLAFNYFIAVRNLGLNNLIFLLLITVFTDTFAYFTGMLIGKHKMSPNISPKKTWEGFVGGLVFGTFISTCFYYTAFSFDGSLFALIFAIACLSIIGQIGDLVFSAIKRYYGVKDYSNLLPGHGGILDRVDSILFVLLAFSFISTYL